MTPRDMEYLESLYRQHYQTLFLYANAVLKHRELAEEAVQDTFVIACGKLHQLRRSPNSAGWLVQTLKNVLSNLRRTRSSLYASLEHLPYEERSLDAHRDELPLELTYGGLLTAEEFRLVHRVLLEGASYAEAAAEENITPEACRKRMQRIREKLRKNLP